MTASSPWHLAPALLALGVPVVFGLAALAVRPGAPFRSATRAAWLAGPLAIGASAGAALRGASPPPSLASLDRAVRLDAVTAVMLILVCTIALVIVRYSRTYLDGDPGQPRYARALLAALAAVTLLVISNHLAVIALAWLGVSLALHQLLTFYRDRPQALVAAHKKFLVSRLADACLVGAIVLIALRVGSLELDVVQAWVQTHPTLPTSLQIAALLLVLAVTLKSAQLPFHGWLTQVMEAPTPVSALLHAGVVNIGGFVMIRLAPLMAQAPLAQGLLVVVGLTTAVIAALVMTTRVSVKVALAWSTCAQMGFMLVQCGLGAWHLALLHLVAHSLYKAHAFLSAGTAVDRWRAQAIGPHSGSASLLRIAGAAAIVASGMATVVVAIALARPTSYPSDPTLLPLAVLLGLALTPIVASGLRGGWRGLLGVGLRAAAVSALYAAWHLAFARLVPPVAVASTLSTGWVVVVAAFASLFGIQIVLHARPDGRLARALQPALFAGLYLDELFTRLTFRVWPRAQS